MSGDGDCAPGGEGEQAQGAGDAVGGAGVGVTAGEAGVGPAGGPGGGPPARQFLPAVGERLGEAHQVLQDGPAGVAVGVAVQQAGAVPGEAVDRVELGEGGQLPVVDPAVRGVEPAAGVGGELPVQGLQGVLVGAGEVLGGAGQGMRESRCPVVGVAVGPAGERRPGGGRQPVVRPLPGPQALGGEFDVEQRDAGDAVGEGLTPPVLGPVGGRCGIGVSEAVGDVCGKALRGVGGHALPPVVRAFQARAAARAR